MKKVFVIVDKNINRDQMDCLKAALLDPNNPCIVANELAVKQVVNVEFDEVEVIKGSLSFSERIEAKMKK